MNVMRVYADGGEIQTRLKRYRGEWNDMSSKEECCWDFVNCDYRIKPRDYLKEALKEVEYVVDSGYEAEYASINKLKVSIEMAIKQRDEL